MSALQRRLGTLPDMSANGFRLHRENRKCPQIVALCRGREIQGLGRVLLPLTSARWELLRYIYLCSQISGINPSVYLPGSADVMSSESDGCIGGSSAMPA